MSMRISSGVVALLALAACTPDKPASITNQDFEKAIADANSQAEDDGRIVCAAKGNAALSRQCTLDRADSPEGLILTIHKPDGGFRRLQVVKDGRGVIAADGAEPAKVTIVEGNQIEVEIGGDRFRLPATIKPGAAKTAK